MTSSTTTARLRYLNNSAHLISYSAPATAAILQARYNHLLDKHDQPIPDTRSREICSACGFNMLWNPLHSPILLEAEKNNRKTSSDGVSRKINEGKRHVVSCRKCLSKSFYKMPIAKRSRGGDKHRRLTTTAASDGRPVSQEVESKKIGSAPRKRVKPRKNQSLQAMLAKSKAEASVEKFGFGLDLMDLMKGA